MISFRNADLIDKIKPKAPIGFIDFYNTGEFISVENDKISDNKTVDIMGKVILEHCGFTENHAGRFYYLNHIHMPSPGELITQVYLNLEGKGFDCKLENNKISLNGGSAKNRDNVMISYRQADLIDKIKPNLTITTMGGWFYLDHNNFYRYYLFFTDEKMSPIEYDITRIILEREDMTRISISQEHTPRGSGFRSQQYENQNVAADILNETIKEIKDIDVVSDVQYSGLRAGFKIRITSR